MSWGENILAIAELYRKEWYQSEDVEAFLKMFCNSEIRVSILVLAYDTLVKSGKAATIESLDNDEKRKLWEEAKRLCENQDKQYVIRVSKAIYSLSQLV